MTFSESWQKTAQDENDRAQELEVRLEAAEAERDIHARAADSLTAKLAAAERVVEAARAEHGYAPNYRHYPCAVCDAIAAVPARGDRRAPEGGSTPPAAIEREPYVPKIHLDTKSSVRELLGRPENLNFSKHKEGE